LQHAFGAQQPIEHHFDTADQNDHKPPENQGMKQSHDGVPEDFGLSNGNNKRFPDAFRDLIKIGFFCEFEILEDAPHGPGEGC